MPATMPERLKHSDPTNPALKWETYSSEYIDGLFKTLKDDIDTNAADDAALRAYVDQKDDALKEYTDAQAHVLRVHVDSQDAILKDYIDQKDAELLQKGTEHFNELVEKGTAFYNELKDLSNERYEELKDKDSELNQTLNILRADITAAFINHERILNEFRDELIEKGTEAYEKLEANCKASCDALKELLDQFKETCDLRYAEFIEAEEQNADDHAELEESIKTLKELNDERYNEWKAKFEEYANWLSNELVPYMHARVDELRAADEATNKRIDDLNLSNSETNAALGERIDTLEQQKQEAHDEINNKIQTLEQNDANFNDYLLNQLLPHINYKDQELSDKVDLQGVPPGGILGAILVKRTGNDFECAWQPWATITTDDIDAIVDSL